MYLLPNQRPEGFYLKILSAKRISLLRVDISDHCLLFRKAIIKQLQARHPGDLSVDGGRWQDGPGWGPGPSTALTGGAWDPGSTSYCSSPG